MKTALRFIVCFGALVASAFAAISSAPTPAPVSPGRIALVVTVPPSVHAFRDDDIANAIAGDLIAEFNREGYSGMVDYDFRSPNRVRTDVPRLEVSLIEWRLMPTRAIECTFTASLVTRDGSKDLGLFTGTSLMMGLDNDLFLLADDYDHAAYDAIDDLYRILTDQHLLPGMPGTRA